MINKKSIDFTVLMSVYYKEKASNIEECFESLLTQTVQATQWVIVKDGPLTDELEKVLEKYNQKYPNLIKFVPLAKNVGLGLALREGMLNCSNEIIARMDTDDICVQDRFEKQLKMFAQNPKLDICSGNIEEFYTSKDDIKSTREVPVTHDEIVKYQKTRSAFNHMAVMFKKSAVLRSGNYEHAPLMEDDMLWTRMILAGCHCANINETLVFARTGLEMITRRGGFAYFNKYRKSRRKIYDTKFISYGQYLYSILIQFVVSMLPKKIRIFVFTKFLRNN